MSLIHSFGFQADDSALFSGNLSVRKMPRTCFLSVALMVWVLLPIIPFRGQDSTTPDPLLVAMNRKLASIIVPKVDFSSTPLFEVVEFLGTEASRLDPAPKSGPTGRGVNIVVCLPHEFNRRTGSIERVTLRFKNIPLLDALHQSAKQTGMVISVQPYDVRMIPAAPGALGDPTSLVQTAPNSLEALAIQHRLERTILSKVEFRNPTLDTALDNVLAQVNAKDTASNQKNVSYTFSRTNTPDANDLRTALNLSRVPSMEVLRLICLQCDVKMKITPQGLVFVAPEGYAARYEAALGPRYED